MKEKIKPLSSPIPAILVTAIFTGLIQCSSAFSKRKPLIEGPHVALYALDENKYPDNSELQKALPRVKKMLRLKPEKIIDIFGNIVYIKKSIWGDQKRRVFYKTELNHLAPLVSNALENLKPDQRLVIISRYDPDKSVLSRMERVTALFWQDESGINLLLGDIRYEIPKQAYAEEDDWTDIYPINMSEGNPNYSFVPSAEFKLKKILKTTHRTWAVFKVKDLEKILYRKEKKKSQKQVSTKKNETDSITKKKSLLDDALEAGLINEEKYNKELKKLEEKKNKEVMEKDKALPDKKEKASQKQKEKKKEPDASVSKKSGEKK